MKWIVILALCCSCGVVTREQWTHAESLCKPHGGVDHVWSTVLNTDTQVRCENEANIEMTTPEKDQK